jgi:cell division protein FtsB
VAPGRRAPFLVEGARVTTVPTSRIRWDRIGRLALVLVLLFVLALYIRPLGGYYSSWQEAKAKRAEVERLRKENRQLRARRAALSGSKALEQEARRLGMVKPGERPYVLKGLPAGP